MNVYLDNSLFAISASADDSGFKLDRYYGRKIECEIALTNVGVRDKICKFLLGKLPGYPMCRMLVFHYDGHRIIENAVKHEVISKMVFVHLNAEHFLAVNSAKGRYEILGNASLEAFCDGITDYFVMEQINFHLKNPPEIKNT
jgi:hypothetical protein